MKRSIHYLLTVLFILSALPCHLAAAEIILNNTPARVYFSPDGGATKAITRQIDQATREVLLQAYLFTSGPIRSALARAQKRGVEVEVILDRQEQKDHKYVAAKALKAGGAFVWLDDRHACAHNKLIIIDRETVITGSFNFTYAAEDKNAENVLIITSQDLAGLYTDNYLKHRRHSKRF